VSTNLVFHLGDYNLLDYCIFRVDAANDAQNVTVDSLWKISRPTKSIKKMILWNRNVFNQIASGIWRH